MGLLKAFADAMGGPKTVCKTLHKVHSDAIKQGRTRCQARFICLTTRYSTIKTIHPSEFEDIATACPDLSALAYVCITRENPQRGEGENAHDTLVQILEFFSNNDPHEGQEIATILNDIHAKIAKNKGDDKFIVCCPECSQKIRIPRGKNIEVTCPSCKATFKVNEDGEIVP